MHLLYTAISRHYRTWRNKLNPFLMPPHSESQLTFQHPTHNNVGTIVSQNLLPNQIPMLRRAKDNEILFGNYFRVCGHEPIETMLVLCLTAHRYDNHDTQLYMPNTDLIQLEHWLLWIADSLPSVYQLLVPIHKFD